MNTQVALRYDETTFRPLVYGYFADVNGIQQIPTVAAVQVWIENIQITLVATPVIDPDGKVTLTWDSADLSTYVDSTPILNCKAEWTLTVGGDEIERTQFFDGLSIEQV